MRARFKQLGKDSVIYGIGGVAARGIGFFLLPVYTRVFSPSEYGTIEMLIVLNGFLGAVLVMGMDSAQSFYFFEQKEHGKEAQSQLISAILQWRLIFGTIFVAIAMICTPLLNSWFFKGTLDWRHFAIAFSGALFTQIMTQSAEVFRLLYRPWLYIGITLGNTLTSAAIVIALVILFDYGVLGYFVGFAVGAMIVALAGWWGARDYLDLGSWHKEWWPKLIRFGAPLVPAGFAMYVMNTADRWFISHYQGDDALGLYAVGAKFVMLISVAVTTFRQALWPVAMDVMHTDEGPAFFRKMAQFYLGAGCVGVILLTAASQMLVELFTATDFHMAYPVLGVLAWYAIFYGLFLIVGAGIWKSQRTWWTTGTMMVASIVNIGLDFYLVPVFGTIGAAAATSISFFLWNLMALIASERLWHVGYPVFTMAFQLLVGVSSCGWILSLFADEASSLAIWASATLSILIISVITFSGPYRKSRQT